MNFHGTSTPIRLIILRIIAFKYYFTDLAHSEPCRQFCSMRNHQSHHENFSILLGFRSDTK